MKPSAMLVVTSLLSVLLLSLQPDASLRRMRAEKGLDHISQALGLIIRNTMASVRYLFNLNARIEML